MSECWLSFPVIRRHSTSPKKITLVPTHISKYKRKATTNVTKNFLFTRLTIHILSVISSSKRTRQGSGPIRNSPILCTGRPRLASVDPRPKNSAKTSTATETHAMTRIGLIVDTNLWSTSKPLLMPRRRTLSVNSCGLQRVVLFPSFSFKSLLRRSLREVKSEQFVSTNDQRFARSSPKPWNLLTVQSTGRAFFYFPVFYSHAHQAQLHECMAILWCDIVASVQKKKKKQHVVHFRQR